MTLSSIRHGSSRRFWSERLGLQLQHRQDCVGDHDAWDRCVFEGRSRPHGKNAQNLLTPWHCCSVNSKMKCDGYEHVRKTCNESFSNCG